MASLKRDTPAGRAALARRRQRAAAVVDHSARFVNPEDEGAIGASEDSNQSPVPSEREQQQQQPQQLPQKHQQTQKPQQHPPPASLTTSISITRSHQRDPPPQQQKPQQDVYKQSRSRLKDPPPRATPASGATSYSTASLPSSDELLERSSQVAQAAASVLASARKSKHVQRSQAYPAANKPAEKERHLGGAPPARKPKAQIQEPMRSQAANETPMQALHNAGKSTAETTSAGAASPSARMAAQANAYAERMQQQHYNQQQQRQQNRVQQVFEPPQHAITPKMRSSLDSRGGREDQQPYPDDASDDHNTPQLSEDEITMEEREPVISRQNEYEVMDAAVLTSGCWIMLRSLAASATVASAGSTPDDSSDTALVGGAGLATPEEIFQVVKSDGSLNQIKNFQEDMTPLRWGDTVVLLSGGVNPVNYEMPKLLGLRKRASKIGGMPTKGRVAWFQPTSEQVETWTLLRGHDGSKYGVRVGLSASSTAKMLAERRATHGECTRTVQSGDPILLRHHQTGGLLSVNMADGSLELVSDSYDSNRVDAFRPASRGTTSGLIGQLQRHDRYFPMDQDTFTFIEACVPPCPRWILGGGTSTSCNQSCNPLGHRMYLHQTYLLAADRNFASPSMQERLFGNMWSSLSALKEDDEIGDRTELADQESIMLDEVLGACLGLEGKHIRVHVTGLQNDQVNAVAPHNLEFRVREGSDMLFDASLRNLAEKILPLGTAYSHVSSFVASHLPGYEYGSVMQAFCEALDLMLEEYGRFVANLEEQFRRPQSAQNILTLRRLHANMIPSLHTMSILEKATFAVRDKTGGSLLNSLSTLKSWSCEGDLVANKVLGILLEKSSIPYMTMLTTWLQDGLLQDPYGEFMIEVNDESTEKHRALLKHSADSDFNNESYLLREEHVLSELTSSEVLLQKVVAAGKYWRAVRSCEVALRKKAATGERDNVMRQSPTVLQYSLSFSSIASFIQSMYESASQALVNLLMEDFNLMDALRTMKQYFLLDHGEFFLNFLDTDAENELLKELGDVSTGRIQHWLRMSVQLTELHGGDDYGHGSRDSTKSPLQGIPQRTLSPLALRCRFQPISLINHIDSINLSREGETLNGDGKSTRDDSLLGTPSRDAYGMSNKGLTGVETFVLDFPSVPFPISLVLAESAISSYQLLFRLIFFAKYVERRLLGIWQDHQAMKELSSVRGLFGSTFLLRQRMLHFAQNLIYYFMFEVIEPNWLDMEKSIGDPAVGGRTVDDIVQVHEAFLHRTVEACLLTNRELVRTLTKLMTTCLMFADQMKLFTEATRIHDESSHIAAERRKAIQRSLNDRGGGGVKAPVDKMAVREAIHSFKMDRQTRLKKQKRRVGRELSSDSYRRMVGRFEEVFSAYLSEFMLQLNSDTGTAYQEHKTNLCIRLDYNGFLSSSMVIDKGRLNMSS